MTVRKPLVLDQTTSPPTIVEIPAGDTLDPASDSADVLTLTGTQTTTNKTLTAPKVDNLFNGTSPSPSLKVTGVASAANWLEVTNQTAGNAPRLRVAAGSSDANADLVLEPKGTGLVKARLAGVSHTLVDADTVQVVGNKVLDAVTILDFTSAQHDHADAAGGGLLTSAAFQVGSGVARTLQVVCTDSTAIANTAAKTAFDSFTFSSTPNTWLGAVGAAVRISVAGKFSTTGSPTLQFTLKDSVIGSVLWDSGAMATPAGVTDELFGFTVLVATRAIGASGVITFSTPGAIVLGANQTRKIEQTISFDFVASGANPETFTITAQWGAANPANTVTLQTVIVEALN